MGNLNKPPIINAMGGRYVQLTPFVRVSMQQRISGCVVCGMGWKADATIRRMTDCTDCSPGTCRECCETGHATR